MMTKYSALGKTRMKNVSELRSLGEGTVIEEDARIYGPEYVSIGSRSYIGPGVYMRGMITIGDDVWIGPDSSLNGERGLIIEDGVGIGNNAVILTTEHELYVDKRSKPTPISKNPLFGGRVFIGKGSNVGVNSTILPFVTIGEGSQIGAGSVVTKLTTIKDYEIWAGNPARKLKNRDEIEVKYVD
jgi:acetyltransferase-like isoleucine patch superfamily enzyme